MQARVVLHIIVYMNIILVWEICTTFHGWKICIG